MAELYDAERAAGRVSTEGPAGSNAADDGFVVPQTAGSNPPHPDRRIWRDAIARRLGEYIGVHCDANFDEDEAHRIADQPST